MDCCTDSFYRALQFNLEALHSVFYPWDQHRREKIKGICRKLILMVNNMKRKYSSQLRPEYIDKAKKIMEQKPVDVGTSENLRNLLGL
jgi:hypothetical protein